MRVPVEIRPIDAGPYPLVPNVGTGYTPHEYFECGDPQWCSHEKMADGLDLDFQRAESPAVFGTDRYRFADEAAVTDQLMAFGFPENFAKGCAVVFKDDLGKLNNHGEESSGVVGRFNRLGYFENLDSGSPTYYPLAVYIKSGRAIGAVNQTFRHELRHALHYIDGEERTHAYHNPKMVRRMRLGGIATLGAGVLGEVGGSVLEAPLYMSIPAGLLVCAAGITMYRYPAGSLWAFDRTELGCEVFAHKHKNFAPITEVN